MESNSDSYSNNTADTVTATITVVNNNVVTDNISDTNNSHSSDTQNTVSVAGNNGANPNPIDCFDNTVTVAGNSSNSYSNSAIDAPRVESTIENEALRAVTDKKTLMMPETSENYTVNREEIVDSQTTNNTVVIGSNVKKNQDYVELVPLIATELQSEIRNSSDSNKVAGSTISKSEVDTSVHKTTVTTNNVVTNTTLDPLIPAEKYWLDAHPNTEVWNRIKKRVLDCKQYSDQIKESSSIAKQFLQNYERGHRMKYQNRINSKEDIARTIEYELMSEVVDELIRDVSFEITLHLKKSLFQLNHSIINAVTNLNRDNQRYLNMSGRYEILHGAMEDFARDYADIHYASKIEPVAGLKKFDRVHVTLKFLDGSNNVREKWSAHASKQLPLFPAYYFDNQLLKEPVVDSDNRVWSGIKLIPCYDSPLLCPSGSGKATIAKLFPISVYQTSVLVLGTTVGQVHQWHIGWNGLGSLLVSSTPLPNRAERSPIVEIVGSITGPSSFISLTEQGTVCVWHSNPMATSKDLNNRKVKHTGNILTGTSFRMPSATMIAKINTLDLTLSFPTFDQPLEIYDTGKSTAFGMANKIFKKVVPDKNKIPTSICYHPSMTLFGTNPSIIVGAGDGSIVKFNMDYSKTDLDAKILYLPPFVKKEYLHPSNAPKGFVLATNSSSIPKKGNKVYREIFKFHKSKIIFMSVVKLASEKIVSVDESGLLALWNYSKEYFEGKNWFRPCMSLQLVLDVSHCNLVGKEVFRTPDEDELLLLKIKSKVIGDRIKDDMNSVKDRSERIKKGSNDSVITETYYPMLSKVLGQFVQYRRRYKAPVKIPKPSYVPIVFKSERRMIESNNKAHDLLIPKDDTVDKNVPLHAVDCEVPETSVENAIGEKDQQIEIAGNSEAVTDMAKKIPLNASKIAPITGSDKIETIFTFIPKGILTEAVVDDYTCNVAGARPLVSPSEDASARIVIRKVLDQLLNRIVSNVDSADIIGKVGEKVHMEGDSTVLKASIPEVEYFDTNKDRVELVSSIAVESSPLLSGAPAELTTDGQNKSSQPAITVRLDDSDGKIEESQYALNRIPTEAKNAEDMENSGVTPIKVNNESQIVTEKVDEKAQHEAIESTESKLHDFATTEIDIRKPKPKRNGETKRSILRFLPFFNRKDVVEEIPAIYNYSEQKEDGEATAFDSNQILLEGNKVWSYNIVEECVFSYKIDDIKMTEDGQELVILAQAQDYGGLAIADADRYMIVRLNLISMDFYRPVVRIPQTDLAEEIMDYAVSPVLQESLTRVVYVLTTNCVRVFSLETAREIISEQFPYLWELPSFSPDAISICSSCKLLILSARDDSRIAIYTIVHELDGLPLQVIYPTEIRGEQSIHYNPSNYGMLLEEEVAAISSAAPDQLNEKAVKVIRNIAIELIERLDHMKAADSAAFAIVETLLENTFATIDERDQYYKRKIRVNELYSRNFGVINPVEWPEKPLTLQIKNRISNAAPTQEHEAGREIENVGYMNASIGKTSDTIKGSTAGTNDGKSDLIYEIISVDEADKKADVTPASMNANNDAKDYNNTSVAISNPDSKVPLFETDDENAKYSDEDIERAHPTESSLPTAPTTSTSSTLHKPMNRRRKV